MTGSTPARILSSVAAGAAFAVAVAALPACTRPATEPDAAPEPPTAPYLLVLGTAQDGGLPHASCSCERCERARSDPAEARGVASLALVTAEPASVFLFDATPDLRQQLDRIRGLRGPVRAGVDRDPVDGIFLTHAHIGHYLGLAFLGFEAVHTHGVPVHCSERLAAFLSGNGPWSQLVKLDNIETLPFEFGRSIEAASGVRVTPIRVPHRDEYSDTAAFVIAGPRRSVLYVPDTDGWQTWDPPLPEVLRGVDVALLDGTFFSVDELPGRDATTIGHPPIVATMDLLEPLVRSGVLEVWFTHLNHSNPALVPGSAERARIEERGFGVLADGQSIAL